MRKEFLDALPSIGAAFDTETWKAAPKFIPPLVCGSFATAEGAKLLDKHEARKVFRRLMEPGVVYIGANAPFDFTVMLQDAARFVGDYEELLLKVFDKFERGEVYDVITAEMLHAIGAGHLYKDPRDGGPLKDPRTGKHTDSRTGKKIGYRQDVVADHVLGVVTSKENDFWRLRYAILERVPMELWPDDARQYPVDDANTALAIAFAQAGHTRRAHVPHEWDINTGRCIHCAHDMNLIPIGFCPRAVRSMNLHAVSEICRAAFALQLGALWGFAIDVPRVDKLIADTVAELEIGAVQFRALGIIRECGSTDTSKLKKLVALAYGGVEGSCNHCGGSGKVLGKRPTCKGCEGSGKRRGATCNLCFGVGTRDPKGLINCPDCSGSGVDLDAAPAIPRTPTEGITTARDVLVDSGSDVLADYGDYTEDAKIPSTYGPALKEGLPLRPNLPLANERVSYSGIVQLMPRGGGVRDCVVARPGFLLGSVDFTGVELCTFGQVAIWTVGYSTLADAINAGMDAHSVLGADLCGRTYEDFRSILKSETALAKAMKDYRQAAKWGNFGYLGGMGEVKFVITNRRAPGMTTKSPSGKVYKGIRFCLLIPGPDGKVANACGEEMILTWRDKPLTSPVCKKCVDAAVIIRKAWRARWKESSDYFEYITRIVDRVGSITHFGSGVVRGGMEFTSAANGYFSSLAAVGAKRALWEVSKECYTVKSSPLYGCRPIGFIHDEIVAELPIDRSHEAAVRLGNVMVREMQKVVPDVKIKAEPALMERFYKGAEPVFENGRLVPWKPKELAA